MVRFATLLAMLTALLGSAPARATNHPWCAMGGEVGTPICGYASFEQCRASSRNCIQNPNSPTQPSRAAQPSRPRGR